MEEIMRTDNLISYILIVNIWTKLCKKNIKILELTSLTVLIFLLNMILSISSDIHNIDFFKDMLYQQKMMKLLYVENMILVLKHGYIMSVEQRSQLKYIYLHYKHNTLYCC